MRDKVREREAKQESEDIQQEGKKEERLSQMNMYMYTLYIVQCTWNSVFVAYYPEVKERI